MKRGNRRTGRELALKVLYSLHGQSRERLSQLSDFWSQFRFQDDVLGEPLDEVSEPVPEEVRQFAEGLVNGATEQLQAIDAAITGASTNWALERMARVDLALLRLAVYELLYQPEVPASVIINEAIEIGKRYGTKETPAFINGILDKIAQQRPVQDA